MHSMEVWLDNSGMLQSGVAQHRHRSVCYGLADAIAILDAQPQRKINLILLGDNLAQLRQAFNGGDK